MEGESPWRLVLRGGVMGGWGEREWEGFTGTSEKKCRCGGFCGGLIVEIKGGRGGGRRIRCLCGIKI